MVRVAQSAMLFALLLGFTGFSSIAVLARQGHDAGTHTHAEAAKMANPVKPDAAWKHGPSDGEIFTVIRNGIPKTSMSAFGRNKKLTERQTLDVVNFVRSLGPKPDPAHAH